MWIKHRRSVHRPLRQWLRARRHHQQWICELRSADDRASRVFPASRWGVIGVLWLVNLSGDGSQEKVRRDTCIGALVVSMLFVVGAVVLWFVPVDTSNDAQGSFGASAVAVSALLVSGILGLVLTLILRLTMPGEARVDRR
ncbi:hypothetical protein [Rathayibacter sp. VKM Ac-2927]|uniref:hypothetical protein n=1 Tax=Rathayibacter sp. VKM Ac-2927 TaxID=2929478 RepID=UPI001FB238CD|nr:hypothetical protein [Rathayibacter sp. VKM Ac-2927]MCJ1687463.1 hypothetical protein [Rathayibacter sp. VKM Ac-2927]